VALTQNKASNVCYSLSEEITLVLSTTGY